MAINISTDFFETSVLSKHSTHSAPTAAAATHHTGVRAGLRMGWRIARLAATGGPESRPVEGWLASGHDAFDSAIGGGLMLLFGAAVGLIINVLIYLPLVIWLTHTERTRYALMLLWRQFQT